MRRTTVHSGTPYSLKVHVGRQCTRHLTDWIHYFGVLAHGLLTRQMSQAFDAASKDLDIHPIISRAVGRIYL